MRYATKVRRAKQLRLTLSPYQAADGRPCVRICQGAVELADLDEHQVAAWLTRRVAERRHDAVGPELGERR